MTRSPARGPARGPSLLYTNSSFLLENRLFCVQTGPGAQPVVQVGSKNSSFLLENSQSQGSSQGSRSVLKTAHFCLRTASFVSKHGQEHSQGSRSVLQTAHFCLRTAFLSPSKARSTARGPGTQVRPKTSHICLRRSFLLDTF